MMSHRPGVAALCGTASSSASISATIPHDNNYRGFEIYRDDLSLKEKRGRNVYGVHGGEEGNSDRYRYRYSDSDSDGNGDGDEEALELDDIDMQHLAATSHPKMKSRCMHSDHVLIGLPTYTQVVKGDMEGLLSFIQHETTSSVIQEFAARSTKKSVQSYAGLMAVHARYRQATAALQRQKDADFEQAGGSIPTNVTGLDGILDPKANRRQKHESRQVVRGLLSQPGLLKAPHRSNAPLAPHSANTAKSRNFQYEYQSHHHGDQEVPVDVYTAIGAKGGVWDGTVYKRTLVRSLFKKLRYKLYFDALHHHSRTKLHARMAVLSVHARRSSKIYKLCFQSILHEFLLAKYTVSRAELVCNLHVVQRVHWPAFDKLRKNRSDCLTKTAWKSRGIRHYRMWYARKFLRLLRRKRNLRQFRELVLQISSLTRRGYHFKEFLNALRTKREISEAAVVTLEKVDNLLVQRVIKAPLLAFATRTAVSAHLRNMIDKAHSHWSKLASYAALGSWVYFTRASKQCAKATDTSGWQLLHRQGTLPMAQWQMHTAKRMRRKLALVRMLRLLHGESARCVVSTLRHRRNLYCQAKYAMKRAIKALWSKSARRGLQCLRRHSLVCLWQRHASKRAHAFVRCAGVLETLDVLSEKVKLAKRQGIGDRTADAAGRLRSQMDAVWVLQTRRASRGRAKSLYDWAPQHAAMAVTLRAFSAWMFAFVRRSSMRAALEKRITKAGTIGPSSSSTQGITAVDMLTVLGAGTDAMQLQAGLMQLREETRVLICTTTRRCVRRLHRSLGEKYTRDAPSAPTAQERIIFLQQQLALVIVGGSSTRNANNTLSAPRGVKLLGLPPVQRSMRSVSRGERENSVWHAAQQEHRQPRINDHYLSDGQSVRSTTASKSLLNYGRSGTCKYTDSNPAPMRVRGSVLVGAGTAHEHSAAALDSSDDEDGSSNNRSMTNAFVEIHSQEREHSQRLERESTLHKFFSHARTLPRSRKHATADDSTSDYLTRTETSTSIHSVQGQGSVHSRSLMDMPPPATGAHSVGSLRTGSGGMHLHTDKISHESSELREVISTDTSVVRAGADASLNSTQTEEHLSLAFSSFTSETSYATHVTGALLDRSFELSSSRGGIEVGGFFYTAMVAGASGTKSTTKKRYDEDSDDNEALVDIRSRNITDVGNSLDAATLLVEATHWSFRKLRRFAKLNIAARRVKALLRRRHLVRGVRAWKGTFDKLQHTLKLCHSIWSRGAVKRLVKQLRLCIKSTANQGRSLLRRVALMRSKSLFLAWKRVVHLAASEHLVRCHRREHRLKHTLHSWVWCVRHIPGMNRLRKKMIRRILYPVVNHWKAKAKRLRKARTVFMLFESSWHQRWLNVYCRTEKNRLYECYDAWLHFVQIRKVERHKERMLQQALLFRSASLRAQCFMVWLDFHLVRLRTKRAKLAKLHMYQRVFMHTMQEGYSTMLAKAQLGDDVFAKKMYSIHFSAWKGEAYKQQVLFPCTFHEVYTKRFAWKILRVQRRVRVLVQELFPYQQKERLRKRFSAWHGLYSRKVKIASGCTKLEHALLQMRQRAILQQWPGRAAFQKAERMRVFMEKKGRSKVVLVNVSEKENEERKKAVAKQAEEEKNRSFLTMRQAAPLERRAALFGMIYSAEDAKAVEDLFGLLRTVMYAWQDQAHTDAFLRGSERLVRFRHKRALLEQSLRIWLGKCPATSHRLSLWINKKFSKHANKKLTMSRTAIATEHLVAQYSKLGLDDMVGMTDD